jgi:hypothetical protein
MSEHILVFRGFARASSWCHVVVGTDRQGRRAVLVGELDDNPGTTATNAIEQVAEAVTSRLLGGDREFELYEYVPKGLPDLAPTFYRIEWKGRAGQFSSPEWHVVDPGSDPWLRTLRSQVMERDYTSRALIEQRGLKVVDARAREELPWAI